jgi:regulatory protein
MRKFKKPIKDEDRIIKNPERSRQKTFDRAVNLLTYKPRSIEELRTRLLEKAWTNEEIVDGVIEKLKEYNYLNDEQFATSFAASKIRHKAVGKRKLEQDLYRQKLDQETIEKAIENAFEETPEEEVIDRAIAKRLRIKGIPETQNEKKNFFAYLMRQGFDYDLIRNKMNELPEPEKKEDD